MWRSFGHFDRNSLEDLASRAGSGRLPVSSARLAPVKQSPAKRTNDFCLLFSDSRIVRSSEPGGRWRFAGHGVSLQQKVTFLNVLNVLKVTFLKGAF